MQHEELYAAISEQENFATDVPAGRAQSSSNRFGTSAGLQEPSESPTLAAATSARRRGPCLSRRAGQSGTVVQHSKTWDPTTPCYGKFWADTLPRLDNPRRLSGRQQLGTRMDVMTSRVELVTIYTFGIY